MPAWPVPESPSREIPCEGPGSFWEDRGDRHHCGVDIFAPAGSRVVAVEPGVILSTTITTSPDLERYWNRTFALVVSTDSGLYCRYAELADLEVGEGDTVKEGMLIGHVGAVINPARVDGCAPLYIQRLKLASHLSMLHFELYSAMPSASRCYYGGNWFCGKRPIGLLDPTAYLQEAVMVERIEHQAG
jgi:murein DD-endopeptidase MepM/ murein hydrolase activator NlpD